jgi:hypothetical protein
MVANTLKLFRNVAVGFVVCFDVLRGLGLMKVRYQDNYGTDQTEGRDGSRGDTQRA